MVVSGVEPCLSICASILPISAFELQHDDKVMFNACMEKQLDELRALTAHAENRRTETGIPRVAMVQGTIPEHHLTAAYEPMINLILRGSKSMTVGGRTLHYDPATYFVMSIGLPASGEVRPSETGLPYLAVSLTLDAKIIANLLSDIPDTPSRWGDEKNAFSVAAVTSELLDAWLRMLRLMNQPSDIPALASCYEREILYRVLQGPLGWMLRDIALPDSTLARVNQAIQYIRRNYALPLRVEELAASVAMSVSAFHRHFKSVTALSPVQYQKQIRLLNARTLLIASSYSVTAAAHEVGYQSTTQFSREYARKFGQSPARDAMRIVREMK
jgi:AraC-like DNA-binding protein